MMRPYEHYDIDSPRDRGRANRQAGFSSEPADRQGNPPAYPDTGARFEASGKRVGRRDNNALHWPQT